MSLIEGIGDEVTLLVAIIIIVAVIVVGWMSTRVDATPYTSIVIIDRDRFVELLRRLRGLSAPASNSATSPLTRDGTGTAAVSSNTASSSVAEDTAAVSNNETATVIPNVRQTGARECVENLESVANSDHPTLEPSVDCHQSADAESQAACSDSQLYSQQCTNDEREALLACSQTNDGSSVDTLNSDTDTSVQQSQASYQEVPSAADELASSQVQIRLQYIDGRQKLVLAHPDDTIGHLKRFEL